MTHSQEPLSEGEIDLLEWHMVHQSAALNIDGVKSVFLTIRGLQEESKQLKATLIWLYANVKHLPLPGDLMEACRKVIEE